MKHVLLSLSAIMLLTFTSCNSNKQEKEEAKTTTDTMAAPAKAPEVAVFSPFTVALIRHQVKDYDKWFLIYQADDSARKANGLTELGLGRGLDNNKEVTVALRAGDIQKAKDFTNSPGLKAAMQKGGVTGKPSVEYITVIRDDNSSIDVKDRLMISHHVKDFDAWLKVFDTESKETRAGYGLIDRAIARGIDDPNQVYVLFAVSDVAKAKARSASPELKNLMTGAGVDGPPSLNFYTLVK